MPMDMDTLLSGLRATAEHTRLRIIILLAQGELNVKDLTRVLGQSQPRVSRHLKLLVESGIVERHREGASVFFRLDDTGEGGLIARQIIALIDTGDTALQRDLARLNAVREIRLDEARSYFSANAAQWNRIRALHVDDREVEAAMLELAGPGPFESMVDLGTGTGRLLELFSDRIRHGIGVDSSAEMLEFARDRLSTAGLTHCQVRRGDVHNLPYDNASHDLVTIHQVLHFIDNPAPAIAEAARILRPGGKLLVVDFAPHELEYLREEHAHRRLGFSGEKMKNWFHHAGLATCRQQDLHRFGETPQDNLTISIWLGEKTASATPSRPERLTTEKN